MRKQHRLWPVLAAAVLLSGGCAGFDATTIEEILTATNAGTNAPLDEATVARGLREALNVGSGRAVTRVSSHDGYLANELIRIRLPEELATMAEALRRIGFSRQVDELEIAMNRAAEEAASEAKPIFVNAIRQMTIADAWGILRGEETAATQYFRQRTEATLAARFQPIIEEKMDQVGLARQYRTLADTYNALPFVTRPAIDLDDYLTDRALDGLFHELAEEERKIRQDPVARTTELLRRVFGRR
ncbi:MAG: DUF4197 domain-containing protein [Acidobacteriota bacterium]